MRSIVYCTNAEVSDSQLNQLFTAAWPNHQPTNFRLILKQSLVYVCAYQGNDLVGYVNVAWDGGVHGFLLDTTVHPCVRRLGIGLAVVRRAADVARGRGIEWLHVDYKPHLEPFYLQCGFRTSVAGVMRLQ